MTSPTRPLALVTGASSGIGADLARELASDGHDLVLTARNVAAMEKLAAELEAHGAAGVVIAADLSKPGAAEALAGAIESRGLTVDVLVNMPGSVPSAGSTRWIGCGSARCSRSTSWR